MKSKHIFFLIVLAIGLLAWAYYYFYIKPYMPKYNWAETYSNKSDQPYGIKLLFDVLKEDSEDNELVVINKSVRKQLPLTATNATYLFIGHSLLADSLNVAHILEFVAKGNDAFIATNDIPLQLFNHLVDTHYVEFGSVAEKRLNQYFIDAPAEKNFSFHYQRLKDTVVYDWACMDSLRFYRKLATQGFLPIATVDSGGVNFMKCGYGKGCFYFHTNPVLFSNYHFATQEGYRYANKCFKPLANRTTYWDELSKVFVYNNAINLQPSPLRFIFAHRGLRWAWYVLIISILLFIVFRSKRLQRVIPIMAPQQNTSAEFCKGVAQLYLQAKNHNHIAPEMFRLFAIFVKSKYGITLKPDNKEHYIPELALKAGLPEVRIKQLFELQVAVQFGDGGDSDALMNLYNEYEYFYKNCR